MRNEARALLQNVMNSLALPWFQASEEVPEGCLLVWRRDSANHRCRVGRLSKEHDKFVFRYEPGYSDEPIIGLPDVNREYRSEELWPFFSVRIPPLDREDMRGPVDRKRTQWKKKGRDLDRDSLVQLGEFGKLSITNPYELELDEET